MTLHPRLRISTTLADDASSASPRALPTDVDLLVIGGGITGAGVARDAAIRGMRVLLIDSHDFASGTSHLTSKLVHGGLRYLEQGRFRLVMEALVERDRLLNRMAPNLVWPLRFLLPYETRNVPYWLFTVAALQFYGLIEHLRRGRRSSAVMGRRIRRQCPLLREHNFAVSFWDAQTNDARLVISTLRSAAAEGACLCNYTTVRCADFDHGAWSIELDSQTTGPSFVRARAIVNATGPWSASTASLLGEPSAQLLGIKGSHILLRRPERFGEDAVIIRSLVNRRPLWVIPWQHRLLVGSTERPYHGDPRDARPTADEVDDLFESFCNYFPSAGLTRRDIGCAYAGVRPIIAQESESENTLSREHRVDVDAARRLITISGGKLTTFRRMAEQAVDRVERLLGMPPVSAPTLRRLRGEPLWPGVSLDGLVELQTELRREAGAIEVSSQTLEHLVRHYGADARMILDEMSHSPSLAAPLFSGLPYTLGELGYLCRAESVTHLDDLLKRRTPLYFLADDSAIAALPRIVEYIAPILGWRPDRAAQEIAATITDFRRNQECFRADTVRPAKASPAIEPRVAV